MSDLRENIIKTAADGFMKFGIRSVSIDDICNKLRISKKTFYTEFKQKDDLVEAVLRTRHYDEDDRAAEYLHKFNNAIDALLNFKNPEVREHMKKEERFRYDLRKYYSIVFERFVEERRSAHIGQMQRLIEWGISDGLFRQELDLKLTSEMAYEWFIIPVNREGFLTQLPKEDVASMFADAFLRVVATPQGFSYYSDKYCK